MIGQQTEERRLFSYEERQRILKKSGYICACCGKKLASKNMSIDHIIPISRGGTNDIINLIPLCYDCNKLKDNMLYIPSGFYSALDNKTTKLEMEKLVCEWFETIKDDFDIQMFPLIAPRYNMLLNPFADKKHGKSIHYARQFVEQWSLVGHDYYAEIEAVTDINIQEIRNITRNIARVCDIPCPLYAMRKLSNDRIMAVCAVIIDSKNKYMTLYMPWKDTLQDNIMISLVRILLYVMDVIAKIPIETFILATEDDKELDRRTFRVRDTGIGWRKSETRYAKHAVEVTRVNQFYYRFS